jgi:hypothetical protein
MVARTGNGIKQATAKYGDSGFARMTSKDKQRPEQATARTNAGILRCAQNDDSNGASPE